MITVASFKSYRLKHDLHFIIDSPVTKPDFAVRDLRRQAWRPARLLQENLHLLH